MIRKPHAPHAPGPRPGTWWKKQRYHGFDQTALNDQRYMRGLPAINVPPVFTAPDKPKPKLGEKSFHPGQLRFKPANRKLQ